MAVVFRITIDQIKSVFRAAAGTHPEPPPRPLTAAQCEEIARVVGAPPELVHAVIVRADEEPKSECTTNSAVPALPTYRCPVGLRRTRSRS